MAEIIPVTEWPDYSEDPTGGNPITHDLNAPYDKVSVIDYYDPSDYRQTIYE